MRRAFLSPPLEMSDEGFFADREVVCRDDAVRWLGGVFAVLNHVRWPKQVVAESWDVPQGKPGSDLVNDPQAAGWVGQGKSSFAFTGMRADEFHQGGIIDQFGSPQAGAKQESPRVPDVVVKQGR